MGERVTGNTELDPILDTEFGGFAHRIIKLYQRVAAGDLEVHYFFREYPWQRRTPRSLEADSVKFLRVVKGEKEDIVVFSSGGGSSHADLHRRLKGEGYSVEDAGMIDIEFDIDGNPLGVNVREVSTSLQAKNILGDIPDSVRGATVSLIERINAQAGKIIPVTRDINPLGYIPPGTEGLRRHIQ